LHRPSRLSFLFVRFASSRTLLGEEILFPLFVFFLFLFLHARHAQTMRLFDRSGRGGQFVIIHVTDSDTRSVTRLHAAPTIRQATLSRLHASILRLV